MLHHCPILQAKQGDTGNRPAESDITQEAESSLAKSNLAEKRKKVWLHGTSDEFKFNACTGT